MRQTFMSTLQTGTFHPKDMNTWLAPSTSASWRT